MNKKTLFIVFLVIISFLYRIYGLQHNPPFWVDEFSSAYQARQIIQHGLGVLTSIDKPPFYFEQRNILTHFLIAGSYRLFGQSEFTTRLPIVIAGSLIPLFVFLLAAYIWDTKRAILASLFTTCSYMEITWSRQAKSYALIELFTLITVYLYLKIISRKLIPTIKQGSLFLIVIILGMLSHPLYYLTILTIVIHFVVSQTKLRTIILTKRWFYLITFLMIIFAYITQSFQVIWNLIHSNFFLANNFLYYHSFLWREYGLISFLGFIGIATTLTYKKSSASLILMYFAVYLIFISFIFAHHMSKYTLSIFPFLYMGMSHSLYILIEQFEKNSKNLKNHSLFSTSLFFLIGGLIILNGYKFTVKPKQYYSVNHDFREIANIDYNPVYQNIIQTFKNNKNVAVIDTWPDRSFWYLGNNFNNLYLFRWENEGGTANGHIKKTSYIVEPSGKKVIDRNMGFVGDVNDLKRVINTNKVGYIFIDDDTLPHDVILYAQEKLKKVIYLDHYPLDDNPYSIWPATLYSWGI